MNTDTVYNFLIAIGILFVIGWNLSRTKKDKKARAAKSMATNSGRATPSPGAYLNSLNSSGIRNQGYNDDKNFYTAFRDGQYHYDNNDGSKCKLCRYRQIYNFGPNSSVIFVKIIQGAVELDSKHCKEEVSREMTPFIQTHFVPAT